MGIFGISMEIIGISLELLEFSKIPKIPIKFQLFLGKFQNSKLFEKGVAFGVRGGLGSGGGSALAGACREVAPKNYENIGIFGISMEIIGISLELFGIIGILKNSKNSKEFQSNSNSFQGNSKIPNFLKKASHLAYVGAWVPGGR